MSTFTFDIDSLTSLTCLRPTVSSPFLCPGALADVDHAYVILFTLFMAGFVGVIEKSGGVIGFTRWLSRYATTPRAGQVAAFSVGLVIFFDDYANILIAGPCMKPMFDTLMMSREKLAFIVDATAAPIASLTPISSWVGFEVSLIQAEMDKLTEIYGEGNLTVVDSGFGVFLQTIQYRYYPIFMLFLMLVLVIGQRDFGPMLIAERKTRVYGRKDGGDGATEIVKSGEESANAPEKDTPFHAVNLLFPVGMLIFYTFFLLIRTGEDGSGTQTFLEIMQESDSYSALVWGTMASTLTAMAFYFIQFKKDGQFVRPQLGSFIPNIIYKPIKTHMCKKSLDAEPKEYPKQLLSWREGMDSFMTGMSHIFLALVLLIEAWAFGHITRDVGLDRYFSNLIVQSDLDPGMLPTISFLISAFIAYATGSSWSTMTIMFPLLSVPTYIKSNGDPTIFYSTLAGVLSGSVAGDHASPVSDTTVLSSLSTGCGLLAHVKTQSPYALIVATWSILVGTIPIGMKSYNNGIAILLGFVAMSLNAILLAVAIINKSGRFDIFTELWIRFDKGNELSDLKEDTICAFESGEAVNRKNKFDHEEAKPDDEEAPKAWDAVKQEAKSFADEAAPDEDAALVEATSVEPIESPQAGVSNIKSAGLLHY